MKTFFRTAAAAIAATLLSSSGAIAQTFQRQGVDLLAQIPLSQFQGRPTSGAAIFGYTSPSGREYALMCVRTGKSVVEVTDPTNPRIVGHITGPTSLWHEVTHLGPYAFGATEGGGGMQVIDLRNVDNGQVSLLTTFTGGGLNNIHTIQANPVTNTVYANGSNLGMAIIDVSNPAQPRIVSRYTQRYVHDCLPVNYTEGQYAGREIVFLFCIWDDRMVILDTTNKAAPVVLSEIRYISNGGPHSGAISADKRFMFLNDELDEGNGVGAPATTYVFNIENLSAPVRVGQFTNGLRVIDHNSWMRGDMLFLAAYRGGVRVYDTANATSIREVGFFDTYPEGDGLDYSGAWGTYAGFASDTVLVSDMQRGLFVLDATEAMGLGARPVDVSFERGQPVSGTLRKELRRDDGEYYVTSSGSPPFASEPDNSRFVLGFQSTVTPRAFLKIDLEAKITNFEAGTLVVEARNLSTGAWDQVGEFTTTRSDRSFSVPRFAATNYASSTGRIELRLRSFANGFSLRPQFNTLLDFLRVEVQRS